MLCSLNRTEERRSMHRISPATRPITCTCNKAHTTRGPIVAVATGMLIILIAAGACSAFEHSDLKAAAENLLRSIQDRSHSYSPDTNKSEDIAVVPPDYQQQTDHQPQANHHHGERRRPIIAINPKESNEIKESNDEFMNRIIQGYAKPNHLRASNSLASKLYPSNSQPSDSNQAGLKQFQDQIGRKLITSSKHIIETSTDNTNQFDGTITIDKIKGIEFFPMIMNGKNSKRAADGAFSTNDKCTENDFDRLIAQKLSSNNLSKPIVKSDGRYDNPFSTWRPITSYDLVKFVISEKDATNLPKSKEELEKDLPIMKPNFEMDDSQRDHFRVTWIGHATLLIQIDGFNIITDPMFSERASFTQFIGPKRFREAACNINSLPKIDAVLISHSHYDHLDADSVKEINDRFGKECRWLVPLGLGEFLDSMSVLNYRELDWWEKDCLPIFSDSSSATASVQPVDKEAPELPKDQVKSGKVESNEVSIYLTPSQHWSRRGVNDINKTLWGSFTIVSRKGSTFFFGGDTGYCSAFKEIGDIFGPLSGAAIPIGAYSPRWFMKASHVDPSEAVQIHTDLRSKKSISIHHSTFALAYEFYKEPPRLLREIMFNQSIQEPFITIKHGETAEF